MRAAFLACIVLAAVAAPAAQAASVSVYRPPCALEQSKYGQCFPDEARFAAAPGEANRVQVTRAVDPPNYQPVVTFEDSGAPVTAGAGCTQVSASVVRCSGYALTAHVDAADGDDQIAGPGVLRGGAGNDTLSGSYILYGGDGDDTLAGEASGELFQGGAGRDTIVGGAGNDTAVDDGGAGEPDAFDGGDGSDTVSYQERRTAVTVALGMQGSEDRLTQVENVRGGAGDDVLTGDTHANTLEGGAGDDSVAGGAGDDILGGQEGSDRLDGGAGNDNLVDGEERFDNRITCGEGRDAADPGVNTHVASDCEDIRASDLELAGQLRLRLPLRALGDPVASLHGLSCLDLPCRLRMTVTTRRGTVLGAARRVQRTRADRLPRAVGLRLSRAGRAALRARGSIPARISVVFWDGLDASRASFLVTVTRG